MSIFQPIFLTITPGTTTRTVYNKKTSYYSHKGGMTREALEGFKATHEVLGVVEGDSEGNIYIYPNGDDDESLVESFNETFSCTLNEFDKGDI